VTPELLHPTQTELGECPLWDARRNALFFVDITERRLHRLDWSTRGLTTTALPALGGALALARDGSLIAGCRDGLYRIDADTGAATFLVDPEPDRPDNRLNEGKCDPQGRFWFGSMSTVDRAPVGGLYRYEAGGRLERVLGDIVIPNALVWLSESRMVFADSFRKTIWSFASDPETGALSERRVFAECTGWKGIPDGIALDAEGCLWNAEFGGGRVVRLDPAGRIIGEVRLPATQVTSCAFAGPDEAQLVIVTTKRLLDAEGRRTQAQAGDLFVVEPGVRGAPVPPFG
jgi:sugar lactone lactonase YvrE